MMPQAELSRLARVQVDIPNELDSLWTLDIKKSTAMPPEEVRNNLGSIIERLAKRSEYTTVFRGKRETSDSIVHLWQRFKGRQGGSYYTVNRDHPLVEILSDLSPAVRQGIENLLKAIESGLPLSSLYLDLNSDKPVENDTDITVQEVEMLLQYLLNQMPTSETKTELLQRLTVSEPFVNYPLLIKKYSTGGNTDA
jgi:hypothetical protein